MVCNDLEKALPEDVVRLKVEHDEYFNRMIPELDKLKVDLMIKKPSDTSRPAQYRTPEIGEGALVQERREAQKQSVKLKPLDPPEFDGKAKEYARFKQRFEEMISPRFDSMGQLEFLERAIPKWVKERMSLVKKTPEQLWKQLDDMFADPKVMLREAMDELHSLDHKTLGKNFIYKFAATLLDTETLLDANENGDYLRHPREVAYLQEKLPEAERLEYIRRAKNYQGSPSSRASWRRGSRKRRS